MYDYVLSIVGKLPSNLEWVYGVIVILLTLLFFSLLFSPLIALFNIFKNKKSRRV